MFMRWVQCSKTVCKIIKRRQFHQLLKTFLISATQHPPIQCRQKKGMAPPNFMHSCTRFLQRQFLGKYLSHSEKSQKFAFLTAAEKVEESLHISNIICTITKLSFLINCYKHSLMVEFLLELNTEEGINIFFSRWKFAQTFEDPSSFI